MGLYSYVFLYRLRQQHRQLHRNYLQNTQERFVSKKCQSSAIHHANLIIGFSTGGVWINLGPLLYHYSDIPGENSIEPTYEMVREIVQGIGFVIEVILHKIEFIVFVFNLFILIRQKERTGVKTTYSQNVRSMLKYEYDSVFFVCRKP
jgi:hypothetical protein